MKASRRRPKCSMWRESGNFIDNGASYTGALQILKVIMGYEYLWQNIRVKGGAYGCMSNFNRIGEGFFVSYRDPNLKRTMEIYEGVAEYLRNFTVSDYDMNKYIIGTISNLDQPMTPAAKGDRSMNLYMNHVSARDDQGGEKSGTGCDPGGYPGACTGGRSYDESRADLCNWK